MKPVFTYVTKDGVEYVGDTAFQVVDAMRADCMMTEPKDLGTYMHGAALRYRNYENVAVRSDSPENFITDLVAGGLLFRK